MKKIIYVFSIILFLLSNAYSAKAQYYDTYSRRFRKKYLETHSTELDLKLLNFTYKEPDIGVKDQGRMDGIGVAYTYHNELMFKAAFDYYSGNIDYKSDSGKLNDVNHYIVELRWLIGRNFTKYYSPMWDYLTSYTGLSYRYWKDHSGGRVTDLGYYGYDRETAYYYSPFGLETIKRLENGWFIGTIIEYDLFWMGKNKSRMSDIDSSVPDLEFNQNDGYGLRFALKAKKTFDRAKIGIVPFINYWNIDNSEEVILFDPSSGFWIFYEPKNKTTELGINLTVEF
ncbi:MAG: hypothetical protein ACMUIM_05355 [bacterium]